MQALKILIYFRETIAFLQISWDCANLPLSVIHAQQPYIVTQGSGGHMLTPARTTGKWVRRTLGGTPGSALHFQTC